MAIAINKECPMHSRIPLNPPRKERSIPPLDESRRHLGAVLVKRNAFKNRVLERQLRGIEKAYI
jgi:hypothetical protein